MSDLDNIDKRFLRTFLGNIVTPHQNMLAMVDEEDGLMNESSSGIDPLK